MNDLTTIFAVIVLSIFLYMTAWFGRALMLGRRDIVDSAWGLGFIVVAGSAFALRNNDSVWALLSLLLVTIWGVRLFLHITSRNWKKKEDYRYAAMGELGSFKIWLKSYTNVFLLQGVLMILISLPVIAVMHTTNDPLTVLTVLGIGVWLAGIVFEAVGDYQLRQFIRIKKKNEVMQSGLWRYSRHPNYFGEVAAWWGAAIVAVSFGQWWGVVGALLITVLITKISGIPHLEKRYADNAAFKKYAKKTSIFIPLPPKKS